MSVLVQTPDGWETVEDADSYHIDSPGILRLTAVLEATESGSGRMPVCAYAPGTWLYAEVEP